MDGHCQNLFWILWNFCSSLFYTCLASVLGIENLFLYLVPLLDLPHLEKRRLRGDLIAPYSFLRRENGEGAAVLFSLVISGSMFRNGTKLAGEVQTR